MEDPWNRFHRSRSLLGGRLSDFLDGPEVADDLDLADEEGFAAACRQGAELGFDGKTLIHPKQIAPCNDAFSPTPEAVAEARRIAAAHAEARAAGSGVAVVDGRLVEHLHVEMAERTLARAEAIAARRG